MNANVAVLPEIREPKKRRATSTRGPIRLADGRMDERAAAEYLGVSTAALRNWRAVERATGVAIGPKYIKLPGRIWYWQEYLERWLWSHVVTPGE